MGLFNIFRKPKLEVVHVELGVADRIIDYLLDLVDDKESIREQIKEINRIRRFPVEQREQAYLPVYLSLEKFIVTRKPIAAKEYFSRKALKKPREFSREVLRRAIKERIEINKLGDNFRVLFLEEPQRSLIFYGLIFQQFLLMLPAKLIDSISKESIKINLFKDIKIENSHADFKAVNKKFATMALSNIVSAFKSLFSIFYDKLVNIESKEIADKTMEDLYNYAEQYGYPLNSATLQVLPIAQTDSTMAAAALNVVQYATNLFAREDLIRPYLEKIKDAEMLTEAEREKIYFEIYIELEKLAAEHAPPAVKRKLKTAELRNEIKEKINIEHLSHNFKVIFLEQERQVIELFAAFYEFFLKSIVIFWKPSDLQGFLDENTKNTLLSSIGSFTVEKDKIFLNIPEAKIEGLPKNKISIIVSDLSALLSALYKKIIDMAGDKRAEKFISDAFFRLKEQYRELPVFDEFIRAVPEGIMDYYKKTSLSPKAAEQVVSYMIELLQREEIPEQKREFEDAKKLPLEEQQDAFFKIYLSLQSYIVEHRPTIKAKEISLFDLKDRIRKNASVKDLEDKFQLLFLTEDEVLVKLVKDFVKECIANFIDKKALIEAERGCIKKEHMLKSVKIDEEGAIDLEPFLVNLKDVRTDKVKVLHSTLSKVVFAVYDKSKSILGEIQAKKLFETAYISLEKKYGVNLLKVLKLIPKGVLEAEKFELLGKEEIEKTAKEMVKIDIMKGEFMNIAAHELKTPLVPIISYTEMLLADKRLPKDVKEKLKICLASAKREADLVSDILDITKLESGTLKLEMEEFNMIELLKEVTKSLEPAVKQKGLYLKAEIPSKLPIVNADRRRIIQVLNNLINNATKFTEKGGITVKSVEQGKEILVSVTDTGMGISKENAKKLFTKFFQVDSSERRKQGGTGLGLAICKGIIEGHKGKMWVESELGKGSTFYFTVPCTPTKSKK